MPTITHRGATVNYGETGTGETALLLHAGGSSGARWRRVAEHIGDGYPGKTRDRFMAQTDAAARAFHSNLANPTTLDDCRGLRLPITVVCGEKTTAPDRRVTELLRDTIPGAAHAVIPGAEHMSPLTHPQAVARIILAHLAALASV